MPQDYMKSGPILRPHSGTTDSTVVILHGYGADADDLFPLSHEWADALPNTCFISLQAPYPCEANPMGRQWFSLFDLEQSNRTGALTYWPVEKILGGLRDTAKILDGWIDEILAEYKIAPNRLALCGFSQGCMLALHTALRRPQPVAGVIGFSGRLLAPELLDSELKSKPPILLVHGDADEIVPPKSLAEAEKALLGHGLNVTAEMRPRMGHSIDARGMDLAREFLQEKLQ